MLIKTCKIVAMKHLLLLVLYNNLKKKVKKKNKKNYKNNKEKNKK